MSRTRIKICGMTRAIDVRAAVEAGADAVGFVFWPSSPRYVTPAKAAQLVADVPAFVSSVGVFVNQPAAEVLRIADEVGLTLVQLHGDEPIEEWALCGRRVIKAVGVDDSFEPGSLAAWPPDVLPLLDAADRDRRGGTGRSIDWHSAAAVSRLRSVMLAGGLRPETVEEGVRAVRPFAVDVASGVELEPGVKDPEKIRAFVAGVARADAGSTR